MKRFSLSVLCLFVLTVPPSAQDRAPADGLNTAADVRIANFLGDVTLVNTAESVRGPIRASGIPLEEGDLLKTGADSTVEVAMAGGTLLHVGEWSVIKFARLQPKNTLLSLTDGTLLSEVNFEKNAGVHFSVRTPWAMATVRGTEFVMEMSNTQLRIGVLDVGHVAVSKRGYKKEVVMHFNQETQVGRSRPPETARTLEHLYHYKLLMSEMRERLKLIHKHWNESTPEQRRAVRADWIKSHPVPKHHSWRHSRKPS